MKNKFLGIIGVLLGIACLLSLFVLDKNKLIIHETPFFLEKYLIVILLLNAGFYFIVIGCLHFIGIVVPYYAKSITEYEKAKNHLFSIILSMPIWICTSLTVFVVSKDIKWKIVFAVVLLHIIYLFLSSARTIKEAKERGRKERVKG